MISVDSYCFHYFEDMCFAKNKCFFYFALFVFLSSTCYLISFFRVHLLQYWCSNLRLIIFFYGMRYGYNVFHAVFRKIKWLSAFHLCFLFVFVEAPRSWAEFKVLYGGMEINFFKDFNWYLMVFIIWICSFAKSNVLILSFSLFFSCHQFSLKTVLMFVLVKYKIIRLVQVLDAILILFLSFFSRK